jgi:hypothetical protein
MLMRDAITVSLCFVFDQSYKESRFEKVYPRLNIESSPVVSRPLALPETRRIH